jgi:YfiH family protein
MQQVHGTEFTIVEDPPDKAPVCDGIFTRREDVALVVQTADCVPILMWDPDQNVVAAVHAGWRGTLGRIAGKAADMFRSCFSSRSESISVTLGPAIGPCCYEVGSEVVDAYTRQLTSVDGLFSTGPRGRQHLDVIEANRRQLVASGISEERIFSTGMCTSCNNGFLYSYRREGKGTGRLYGAISVARS